MKEEENKFFGDLTEIESSFDDKNEK